VCALAPEHADSTGQRLITTFELKNPNGIQFSPKEKLERNYSSTTFTKGDMVFEQRLGWGSLLK
jgi:hypothetical protein